MAKKKVKPPFIAGTKKRENSQKRQKALGRLLDKSKARDKGKTH